MSIWFVKLATNGLNLSGATKAAAAFGFWTYHPIECNGHGAPCNICICNIVTLGTRLYKKKCGL